MMGVHADDEIVALSALRKIFLRVIYDMVRSERSGGVDLPRATHGGDFGAERFGNLNGEGAHTTRCAVNQDLAAFVDASLITKTLEGSEGCHGHRRGVLKRTVGRLWGQLIFLRAHVLGEGSPACAEYVVAWLEVGYVSAHRFHSPCDIVAGDLAFWCAQPAAHQAKEERFTSHEVQVNWIYGSGV